MKGEDKPEKKKKHRVRRIALVFLLLLLIVTFVALVYFRVQGFKRTLIELVESRTNGAYALEIGNTNIDYRNLKFGLTNVVISKTDKSDTTGLQKVTVPAIEVNIGSFLNLLTGGQLELEEFTISEPYAEIGGGSKDANDQGGQQQDDPVNIAAEIVAFYPAIKAVLDKFNIHQFRITRAGLTLEKTENPVQVRLVDLLVSEWNMRNLSDKADFLLQIGGQEVAFNTSSFSFSDIIYDYQEHQLKIEGYSFIQKDSLNREILRLEGASVIIGHMDYDALLNEQYVFRELIINNPAVTANIYPHEQKKENKSRQPISDLLKKNLGELLIEKGAINKAKLSLNILKETDTVALFLPEMTLTTENFRVTGDSSTLMIEKLNLELAKTDLNLGNGLGIAFSKLEYDEDYNARITDVVVTDLNLNSELIRGQLIELFRFNIFDYIYTADLSADSVLLEGGGITFFEDVKSFAKSGGKKKEQDLPTTVHIGKTRMQDFSVNYAFNEQQIVVENITAEAHNVVKEQRMSYDLSYLVSPRVVLLSKSKELEAEIRDLSFQPSRLRISVLDGKFKDLEIRINELNASPENFELSSPFYYNWNQLNISEIDVSGSIPEGNNDQEKSENGNNASLTFESVKLDKVRANLRLANGAILAGNLNNINITGIEAGNGIPSFTELNIQMEDLLYSRDSLELRVSSGHIASESSSILSDITLKTSADDSLQIQQIAFGQITRTVNDLAISSFDIEGIRLAQNNSRFVTKLDSIQLLGLTVREGNKPFLEELAVYGADVQIRSEENSENSERPKKKNKKGKPFDIASFLGQATIYPGRYAINNNFIDFGKVHIDTRNSNVSIDINEVKFENQSSTFRVGRIENYGSDLIISKIEMNPKATYVEQMEIENDVIGGKFEKVTLTSMDWDSLFVSNKFLLDRVVVDGFRMELSRDKTLPDPEPKHKPHLLTDLIPKSEKIVFNGVDLKNGTLTYHEKGEKTGMTGTIRLNDINARLNLNSELLPSERILDGSASLYNQGRLTFAYTNLPDNKFNLQVRLLDFPMDSLNAMVDPLESVKIKSGYLREYDLNVIADSTQALGEALITYEDLHIEIYKRHEPDVKNLGSKLLTLLADGIILKHSKTDAKHTFEQERIPFKGPVNYWVKSAIHGAMASVRKGKSTGKNPN